jgi:2'-5' RNA ligase
MNTSFFRGKGGLERLAVYGILDRAAWQGIRREQRQLSRTSENDLALRIPVHITLRGPFLGSRHDVGLLISKSFLPTVELPIPVFLDKPSLTETAIAWRLVARSHRAWSTLSRLHMALTRALSTCICRDDVPLNHQNEGFLPHVTLGWGVTLTSWASLGEVRLDKREAMISNLALAYYPEKWPRSGRVAVEEISF